MSTKRHCTATGCLLLEHVEEEVDVADSVEELVSGVGRGLGRPSDRQSTPQGQCWGPGAGEQAPNAASPCPLGALRSVC